MLFGVVAVAEAILLLAAVQKVMAPASATAALGSVGLHVHSGLVRLGAAIEVAAAAGALATGHPVFAALAAGCYGIFAVFVAVALRQVDRPASCGCFAAAAEAPPTIAHLVFDLVAAAACGAATLAPVPGLAAASRHTPGAGAPLLALVVLGCWLSWVLLTVAPQTAAAARRED